ncbi:MAG: 2-oxoglutarate dehydrogenase, E2 component, dihydrolipoamide succinyltransferase [Actinomycetes bacterium]
MPHFVTMPQLGESITEGTVTRWLKQVGDLVKADEPLLEVSTDKVDTELPAPVSGVLLSINVSVDQTVAVGTQLGVIGEAHESPSLTNLLQPPVVTATPIAAPAPAPVAAPVVAPVEAQVVAPAPAAAPAPVPASAPTGDVEADHSYVTPLVRRMAADSGLDITAIKGTGVGGRIRREDVMAAAEEAATARAAAIAASPVASTNDSLAGRTETLSRMRRVIATRMVESLQTTAQLTTVIEVDLTRVASLRVRHRADFVAREGVNLTYLPFIARACVEALKTHPVINASMNSEAGTITYHEAVHLAIAVDTERGLMVPVISDADDLNIAGLARRISDVAERTRTNKISPDELSGGTFTLTNTGSRGALFDTPILNLPQSAIVGTGAVVKRPVVMTDDSGSDVIAIRSMAFFAITYDHRIVDGADAARFLTAVKARLEEGAFESDLH